MKKLLLLNILLVALSVPAHAATIQALATDLKKTYSSFSDTAGSTTALSDSEILSIIGSNPNTAIYGNSAEAAPYDYSVIDLGFGEKSVITGSGVDLTIFSIWSGYSYSFGLEAYDVDGNKRSSYMYNVTDRSIFSECTNGSCPTIVTTSINLFSNDKTPLELADDIELSYISLFIGGTAYNGITGGKDAYSNFTLAGAFYTKPTVVPLPLSVVLFGSGLGLLGWTGRRKQAV